MSKEYTLKEVRIDVQEGVTVIAEIDSVPSLRSLLLDLSNANLKPTEASKEDTLGQTQIPKHDSSDTPESRIEARAGVEAGTLSSSNLVAFKDDVPQLLRPGAMSAAEALILLLFAVEAGLQTGKVDYKTFKDLYEAQNIKSGSPLTMTLTNLRNGGYLDKNVYQSDRGLRLTAKGERKAVDLLRKKKGG